MPSSWLYCVWSVGLFCASRMISSLFFGAQSHVIRCFFCFGSTTTCSNTTLCESGGSPESPSSKGGSDSGTLCDRSHDAWTPEKCNRSLDVSPGFSWLGISDFRGSWEKCHSCHVVLRLAPFIFPSLTNYGDSPFSIHRRRPFHREINPETDSTASESSNSIIVTKTSKSSTFSVASSVDSVLPLTVVKTEGSFYHLMISFSPEASSLLLIIWRDASLTEMRQLSLELPCWEVGRFSHAWTLVSLT